MLCVHMRPSVLRVLWLPLSRFDCTFPLSKQPNQNHIQRGNLKTSTEFGILSLVGQPVGDVEDEEHGRRDPHRPSVDVLAELVHGRIHAAVVHLRRIKPELAGDSSSREREREKQEVTQIIAGTCSYSDSAAVNVTIVYSYSDSG